MAVNFGSRGYEESGMKIKALLDKVKKLGYYLIEEKKSGDKYLQERYIFSLDEKAKELALKTHKDSDDKTLIVKFVKADSVAELNMLHGLREFRIVGRRQQNYLLKRYQLL